MARLLNVGETVAQRSDEFKIDPEQIVAIPDDNTRQYGLKAETVLSYARDFISPGVGQITSINCRELSDKRPAVYAGFHRLAAAILVKRGCPENGIPPHPDFKIRCTVERISAEAAKLKSAAENRKRRATSVIDDAANYQLLKQLGHSDETIAGALAYSIPRLHQIERLMTLEADVRKRIHEGEISAEKAFALLDFTPAERKAAIADSSEPAPAEPVATTTPDASAVNAVLRESDTLSTLVRDEADGKLRAETGGKVSAKALGEIIKKKKLEKGGKVNRTAKQQIDDWTELKDDGSEEPELNELAKVVIGYIQGRRSFESVKASLRSL